MGVFGLGGALHQPRYLPELPPHLLADRERSAAHSPHRQSGEEERDHPADEKAHDDVGVGQADDNGSSGLLFGQGEEGGQPRKRRQSGGRDSEPLAHGRCRVAHGVQGFGALSDLLAHVTHHGDARGVVGYGPVAVDGQKHAERDQHALGGDGYSKKALLTPRGDPVGDEGGDSDKDDRQDGTEHADRQSLNDVGGGAHFARLGDSLDGALVGREVLGRQADEETAGEACDHGVEDPDIVGAQIEPGQQEPAHQHQPVGGVDAAVHRRSRLCSLLFEAARGLARSHEESPHYGGHYSHGPQEEREERAFVVAQYQGCDRQDHGGGYRGDVRLEEVGAHPGDVADVVTHVVRYDSGVSRVVLRYAGLDLAHHVCAYVRALGEDAATDPEEKGHERSPDSVTQPHVVVIEGYDHNCQAQKPQADDTKSHYGAAGKRHPQGLRPARTGGSGGPVVGPHRDAHPQVTREG